jgi:hypothetical protein
MRSARLLSILLAVLVVLGVPSEAAARAVSPAMKKAYLHALAHSQVTRQRDISRELIAIVPEQDPINKRRLCGGRLVWEGEPGQSRVLVTTFMTERDYDAFYRTNLEQGQESYSLKKALWVTAVPELRNYFMAECPRNVIPPSCPPSPLRIVKLLGLRPDIDYGVLVDFWVQASDLFRPTADPEITDHEAEPATRIADGVWSFRSDSNPFIRIDDQSVYLDSAWAQPVGFRDWYVSRAETIYRVGSEADPTTWGWPWTRLGYTFDWGKLRRPVGASEFLVRLNPQSKEVTVKLKDAAVSGTPSWRQYFRCHETQSAIPHQRNVPDNDFVMVSWANAQTDDDRTHRGGPRDTDPLGKESRDGR